MTRAPIGLGDVMRAVHRIAPGRPQEWADIAAVLGYEFSPPMPAPPPPTPETVPPGQPREVVPDSAPGPSEASLRVLDPVEPKAVEPKPVEPNASEHASPYLVNVPVLAPDSGPSEAAVIEPLLAPSTEAATVRALVVTPDRRGAVDVRRAVDAVASCRPLGELPRERSWSISRDVVVLVDLGPGMDAFREDVELLMAAVSKVAGSAAVRPGGFVDSPLPVLRRLGVHRASVVLVLTDLGDNPLASPAERSHRRWLELADATQAVAARAVLLVPWQRDRWPSELTVRLPLATWDRLTTVADVLHAVRAHG